MSYQWEIRIHRYLLCKKRELPISLVNIINYFPETYYIRRHRCPWCGREFKSRLALRMHLKAKPELSECSFMYQQFLKSLVSLYIYFKSLTKRKTGKTNRWCIDIKCSRSIFEILDYFLENYVKVTRN